jgi:hypothetical protein
VDIIPSVWIVTKPAAQFLATLNVVQVPPGTLQPTNAVLQADSLDTLVSRMPQGRRRVPRFPAQAVTVLENWV